MATLEKMLRQQEFDRVWDKYCGFLDLTLKDFMQIQERLLMEQIELLSSCQLGRQIMGHNNKPRTVKEFRESVPLTTYEDYVDVLLNKNEEALPSKPMYWIQTTWRGGTHKLKLAPYSESMVAEHTKAFIASLILATSKGRGNFSLRENDKFLYGMAPLPYLTGLAPYVLKNEISFEYLPSIEKAEGISFEERNRMGFELAFVKGVDLFFGLSSILVKIGEEFTKGSTNSKFRLKSLNPEMLYRLVKAYYKKNIKKQEILPKDLWSIKGILCAGTDTHAFKEKIEYYWGIKPIEIYGGTEITTTATETWGDSGLTFFPDVNFLEFIPEKDALMSLQDKSYVPKTMLMDEIKPGQRYELVTTKFRGGAFVRYRVGDIIECVSLGNEEHKIALPQIRFVDRISDVIDLAGFTRITATTIEKALQASGIKLVNWAACKEYEDKEPILHIYAEPQDEELNSEDLRINLNRCIQEIDPDYSDLHLLLGKDPLRVTVLYKDAFEWFKREKNGSIKRINPSEWDIQALKQYSIKRCEVM